MSGRVKLGATQQDAISLSSDADATSSISALSVTSDELPDLDDIITGKYRPSDAKTPDDLDDYGSYASQRAGPSSAMSRLTQLPSTTKSPMPSSSVLNRPSSASKGKRRMVLDETLINGKDYTPSTKQRRRPHKLLDGQSKLSQFLSRDPPPTSGAGPSRLSRVISKEPPRGTSYANAIDLDLSSSDDDHSVAVVPRRRQMSRQPSRPPLASSSRRLFTRQRSATSFSDAPIELPSLTKGKSPLGADEDLLDWLRISPPLSSSPSSSAAPSPPSKRTITQTPSKDLKRAASAALQSPQPDRSADTAVHQPSGSQRARSVTRLSPTTPRRRTRTTFLPPPKLKASGSLELVPETPPRPKDLLTSLARTPTPSPAKARIDPSPLKVKSPPASPIVEPVAPLMKRRRAAFEELDEESYRPSPTTKLGREVRQLKKREVAMPADPSSASRPRRVAAVPGKYKLPTLDTPIHQWPTTRGSPRPLAHPRPPKSTPSKMRNVVAAANSETEEEQPKRRRGRAAAAESEREEQTHKRRRGRAAVVEPEKEEEPPKRRRGRAAVVDSEKEEEPPKRRRGRAAAAESEKEEETPNRRRGRPPKIARNTPVKAKDTPRKVGRRASARTPKAARPLSPSLDGDSESSLSTPPPPAELPKEPTPPESPVPGRDPSPPDDSPPAVPAEPEEDLLAEFAEYADWPGSPSQSQHTTESPKNGLVRTLSGHSHGRASASPVVKRPSFSPLASQNGQLAPSQSSQKSITTRVLEEAQAEKEARERAAEQYARLLEQRTAARISERVAATPSDSEDEELHLSQVLENQSPEEAKPERRSSRIHDMLENKAQQRIIAAAQALTEEELAADRQMNALYRMGKKKIDHDAFFRAADIASRVEHGDDASRKGSALDLSFLDGEDRDAIADCAGTQTDPGEAAKRQERAADLSSPTFWKFDAWAQRRQDAEVPLPATPFEWPQLDLSIEEAVCDVLLSGTVREIARDDGAAVRWLFDLALAAKGDDLSMLAIADIVAALCSWERDPFEEGDTGFFSVAASAWDELGAAERQEDVPLRIGQSRESSTTIICAVAKALSCTSVLPGPDAVGLIQRLAVLAVDPSTSAALRTEIADTIESLLLTIETTDSWSPLMAALADDMADLPLVVQARAVCMLGLGSENVRVMVRWTALALLLRSAGMECDFSRRSEKHPTMADLHAGMEPILSGLREAEPDYYRLIDQLSLWSSAAGDTYVLVQRWWKEKERRSEELAEAEQAEESLGLDLDLDGRRSSKGTNDQGASRSGSVSPHDESRASSALTKVKLERISPGLDDSENENPLSLFHALKYAANKVRDDPGTSPLLKSRLNQLAQCIHQNVVAETRLLEAEKAARIYERGYLEKGTGGQTRLSFGTVGVKVERSSSDEE